MFFVFTLFLRLLAFLRLVSRPTVSYQSGTNAACLTSWDLTTGKKRVTSLKEVIENVPSLVGPSAWYIPTTWLSSGNLMTIYCTLASFSNKIEYTRKLIRLPDGGTLALDFTPPLSYLDPIDARPILLVCHGITGGCHENYVITMLAKVTAGKEEGGLGWRGCVVNFRGCAGSPITSEKLYHGGYTDDLRCALAFISHHAAKTPLYGLGFSLGANVLAKYLGEEGETSVLKAGVVLSCPWDFLRGHVYLSSTWLRNVYSRAMARNFRAVIRRHKEVFENDARIDWEALMGNPYQTLYEFDSIATAPLGGFKTASEYYRSASATQYASNIAVPLLSIHAADDPVVAVQTVPSHLSATNPWLVFVTTLHGGHLGWFSGLAKPKRWITKPVLEFFREVEKAGENLARVHPPLMEREDGMKLVLGKEELVGFQELLTKNICVGGNNGDQGATRGF